MLTLQQLQIQFAEEIQQIDYAKPVIMPGLITPENMLIYCNNYYTNLTLALQEVYPMILQLVGAEFFTQACHVYIQSHPSDEADLHRYGKDFGTFLSAFQPAQDLLYLAEVAQLEWARHILFFSPNCDSLDTTALQQVTPEDYATLKFSLSPACMLFDFNYPILAIAELCQQPDLDIKIDLDAGGDQVLVLRSGLDVVTRALSKEEYVFLQACQQDTTFGKACDRALAINETCNIGQILQQFIQNQAIVGFA